MAARWLEKIIPPATPARGKANLPAKSEERTSPLVVASAAAPQSLPAASVIYGVAASALLVLALYFLFTGLWFTGFLVLLPAACFLGFALQHLKGK